MNYIKHLNQFLELVSIDDRLTPHHISVYMALFQQWNKNRFPDALFICRNEIMQAAKVGSTRTYYQSLSALHEFGYIVYTPSKCPITGSKVSINPLFDESEADEDGEESPSHLPISTQVKHGQNRPITRCKSDACENAQVAPLLKHNINLLNIKTREAHARKKKEGSGFHFKNLKGEKLPSGLDHLKNKSVSVKVSAPASIPSGPGLASRIKKEIPRNFLIPTLEQVKDFFLTQLSGNFENEILNSKNREFEAEKFFNHYESNGWSLGGKMPMRNWKASCRSWVAKIPYFSRLEQKKKRSAYDRLHAKPLSNYAVPL